MRLCAPKESPYRPLPGRLGGLLNYLRIRTTFQAHARSITRQIAEFASEQRVERVLMTLNTQTLNAIAADLAKQTGLPLFCIVWDPPVALARYHGWDLASTNWSRRKFDSAMKASRQAMVVSEAMVQQYERDYGVPCVIVRHAFEDHIVRAVLPTKDESVVRIGFAGTLYDQSQMNCLIAALNLMDWVIDGRPVSIRMIGNFYRFTELNGPANIELLGWRSTEDTRRLLSQCDITYLPVSFAERFSEFARLAFPTKLSTFLAAGRPVLVHGPDVAAPVPFCRKQGFGVACTSMDAMALKDVIAELMTPGTYEVLQGNVRRTCIEHFSRAVMKRQFAQFIGVDEALLND
jgi:hypothetical protein